MKRRAPLESWTIFLRSKVPGYFNKILLRDCQNKERRKSYRLFLNASKKRICYGLKNLNAQVIRIGTIWEHLRINFKTDLKQKLMQCPISFLRERLKIRKKCCINQDCSRVKEVKCFSLRSYYSVTENKDHR